MPPIAAAAAPAAAAVAAVAVCRRCCCGSCGGWAPLSQLLQRLGAAVAGTAVFSYDYSACFCYVVEVTYVTDSALTDMTFVMDTVIG
jgi:hypothetical protein